MAEDNECQTCETPLEFTSQIYRPGECHECAAKRLEAERDAARNVVARLLMHCKEQVREYDYIAINSWQELVAFMRRTEGK